MRRVLAGRTAVPALPEPFVPRPRSLATLNGTARSWLGLCPGRVRQTRCWPTGLAPPRRRPRWPGPIWAVGPMQIWPAILTALRACPAVPPESTLHELGRSGPSTRPGVGGRDRARTGRFAGAGRAGPARGPEDRQAGVAGGPAGPVGARPAGARRALVAHGTPAQFAWRAAVGGAAARDPGRSVPLLDR